MSQINIILSELDEWNLSCSSPGSHCLTPCLIAHTVPNRLNEVIIYVSFRIEHW